MFTIRRDNSMLHRSWIVPVVMIAAPLLGLAYLGGLTYSKTVLTDGILAVHDLACGEGKARHS